MAKPSEGRKDAERGEIAQERRRDDALRRALVTRPKPHKNGGGDKGDSKPSPKPKPTRHAKASDR
jgi:hypothetical protein